MRDVRSDDAEMRQCPWVEDAAVLRPARADFKARHEHLR
jgi:hypothetical protein